MRAWLQQKRYELSEWFLDKARAYVARHDRDFSRLLEFKKDGPPGLPKVRDGSLGSIITYTAARRSWAVVFTWQKHGPGTLADAVAAESPILRMMRESAKQSRPLPGGPTINEG